uniref:tRNA pseudouridine synthase n=1 Tax=Heterorhabditis bacteriophora TaxID=37862 RepID=A0A1I7X411_HETBA
MLKRILQRFGSVMTKIESEAKAVLPSLHSVKSGKIEKSVGHGSSTARAVNDGEKKKRIKMSKYAMLLAYQGKEYFGMQIQKGHPHPTIESHLLDAMHKLGWITEEMRTQPNLFYFQRAARTDKAVSAVRQMCGMQLPLSEEYSITGPAQLNDILPKDIRVVGMRRATNWFHPQKLCDARTYSYTLPTFAFAKPTELTTASFRIKQETIDEINSLLEIYLGTHNFFNYTSKR